MIEKPKFLLYTNPDTIIMNGQQESLGVARDYLSDEMADALVNPDTGAVVANDVRAVSERVANGKWKLKDIRLSFEYVSTDESGLSVYEEDGKAVTLIPGLSGLESYDIDIASSDITQAECAALELRLYCGINLAHLLINDRLLHDNFFKVKFRRQFGVQKQGVSDSIDTFSEDRVNDALRRRHHRLSIARLASGIVMSTIIKEDDQELVRRVLAVRYEDELAMSEITANEIITLFNVQEDKLPPDTVPTTARGYLDPLSPSLVDSLLLSTIRVQD